MILYDNPIKLGYFAPYKTGTSTISSFLRSVSTFRKTAGDRSKRIDVAKHSIPDKLDLEKMENDSYLYMISVRNPYSRAASLWAHFNRHYKDFDENRKLISEKAKKLDLYDFFQWYAKSSLIKFQSDYWEAMPSRDFVIRFETLNEDLKRLPFFPKGQTIPRLNENKEYKWIDLYKNEKYVSLIRDLHKVDFQNLGYSLDINECLA